MDRALEKEDGLALDVVVGEVIGLNRIVADTYLFCKNAVYQSTSAAILSVIQTAERKMDNTNVPLQSLLLFVWPSPNDKLG